MFKIGSKEFDIENRCYIMGILNVTPDSFSDGGKWNNLDNALKHAEQMIEEGASIIDVGGESTRPGHVAISEKEEIERVIPVIKRLKREFDVPVSIDSYKPNVAAAALEAGADLVNDIWGLKHDEKMAELIAKAGVPCCLMHNRHNMDYVNFIADMKNNLRETIAVSQNAGIYKDKNIIDPGVGFGKTYENNLTAINHLEELRELGYPILLATSRKSVIGLTLDLPADKRIEGTIATSVMGVLKGASFVRVHDVKENLRAIRMTEAILRG